MTKISRQKIKYFENEKSFYHKIKSILGLKGLSLEQIKQFFLEVGTLTLKHSKTIA